MNATFNSLFEKIRPLAVEPPDTHLADTLNELVDLAVSDIKHQDYNRALRALQAIKESSNELRAFVPSSGQVIQETIEEIQRKAYIHRLEAVAFSQTGGFKQNRQLIEERFRAAEECDEFVREVMSVSIAYLDPEPVG